MPRRTKPLSAQTNALAKVSDTAEGRGHNQTAATPPKKTDDEEIVETLTHRYHRNLRFFTDWNNDDVLQTISRRWRTCMIRIRIISATRNWSSFPSA